MIDYIIYTWFFVRELQLLFTRSISYAKNCFVWSKCSFISYNNNRITCTTTPSTVSNYELCFYTVSLIIDSIYLWTQPHRYILYLCLNANFILLRGAHGIIKCAMLTIFYCLWFPAPVNEATFCPLGVSWGYPDLSAVTTWVWRNLWSHHGAGM